MNSLDSQPLPRVSVAICTYNRPDLLAQTLKSVLEQDYPVGLLEVLVIDNNSPPSTRAVVESFQNHRPAPRWVQETKQGLTHARNRAIQESTGELLIFADDDIVARPGWVREMVRPFIEVANPRNGAIAGTVIPVFPHGCPRWLERYIQPQKFRADAGPLGNRENPMGASLAFPREIFDVVGVFRVDLGRRGDELLMGDETELLLRIRRAGYTVWFAPAAVIEHQMPRSRLTLRYACRNAFDSARSRVIEISHSQEVTPHQRISFLLSRLLVNTCLLPAWLIGAALCALVGQVDESRRTIVRLCRSLGYIRQILRT